MSTIEKAIEIALRTHAGQVDKAGEPYILHPLRVMLSMENDTERQVAVLHDVIEDGEITSEILRAEGFSNEVCKAVAILTKIHGESYEEYLSRLDGNLIARNVKLADLNDNLNLDRIKKPTQKDKERMEKYRKAVAFLKEKKRFSVFVDENSHYDDEKERYLKGNYVDCKTAVDVCKQIVDDFLQKSYSKGKSEDQLWREYASWGEEPFIVVSKPENECPFSAWDYAKEKIREIVKGNNAFER